ncbi:uncharacterized protein DNG_06268 [Cephalotrichum gorgonifer]|uniref:Uncharacterized protein n=1 Tax=Cephalotrichum gorgonifer TaxID=2041049 RepID=A0AAE8SWA0_9PEZI|nr:uncharacterized protein DNG_06268 [Cephalotrichum gorgonifer]
MARLVDLVDDVIVVIAAHLPTEADLSSLTRINRRFYTVLNRVLYSHNARFHGFSALTWAARLDAVATAKYLLAGGACPHEAVLSALNVAAKHGSVQVTRLLLATEIPDPSQLEEVEIHIALSTAAESGHIEVVKLYLADGRVSPRKPGPDDYTPFALAAQFGHPDLVELFLHNERLDPLYIDKDGWTLLFYAAMATDNNGGTALSQALIQSGHHVNVQALLDAGLDPRHRDSDENTPLHNAIHDRVDCPESIELLLRTPGVDPNALDKYGFTPLIHAAADGCVHAARCLAQDPRVLPNVIGDDGLTALLHAARKGKDVLYSILLFIPGIDPNIVSSEGMTAFHYAVKTAEHGYIEDLLADPRVDTLKKDSSGRTPIIIAAQHGHRRALELLWKSGRCSIDDRDDHGRNAMSYAAESDFKWIIEDLLEIERKEPDVNWLRWDNRKRDPLWYAARHGYDDIVYSIEKSRGSFGYDSEG